MTKISGSGGSAPVPGSDSGGASPTEGPAPKKPFEDVMGKKGDGGGQQSDDGSKKQAEARPEDKKPADVAKKAEVKVARIGKKCRKN